MSTTYASLNEFRDFATPNYTANASDDSVIDAILKAVSNTITNQTCRQFLKGNSETRYYTALDYDCVEIDEFISVSEIKTDDGLRTYATTWGATDYDLTPYNAAAHDEPYTRIEVAPTGIYAFPMGISKGVKVTGVFGWPVIPDAIRQATLIATKSIYNSRFGQNENSAATMTAAGIVITPQDFPAECWTLINPYRKRR